MPPGIPSVLMRDRGQLLLSDAACSCERSTEWPLIQLGSTPVEKAPKRIWPQIAPGASDLDSASSSSAWWQPMPPRATRPR
jgi:hypothetical protein